MFEQVEDDFSQLTGYNLVVQRKEPEKIASIGEGNGGGQKQADVVAFQSLAFKAQRKTNENWFNFRSVLQAS